MSSRCPACNSRRFHVWRGKGKCYRCGYIWRDPSYHKTIFSKDLHIGNEKHQNPTRNHEQNNKDILVVDLHDNIYKFKILKDNPDVIIGSIKQMKNWKMEILERGEVIYRRTTKHVVISIKRRFLEQIKDLKGLTDVDQKIKNLFIKAGAEFQEEFEILLDLKHPIPIMKEIKAKEGFRSPIQFQGKKVKCVYPDGSIEWIGSDAVETFKNFIENLSLESKANQLQRSMDGGFDTIAYLLSQQNEILLKLVKKESISRRFLKWLKIKLSIDI